MNARAGEVVLVDHAGRPIGAAPRVRAHSGDGELHLAFTVVLLDESGRLVLARRAASKALWPGHEDATVASHPSAGEDVVAAAARRVEEELGTRARDLREVGAFAYRAFDVDPSGRSRGCEHEHCVVLLGVLGAAPSPDPAEIDAVRAIPLAEAVRDFAASPDGVAPWAPVALLVAAPHLAPIAPGLWSDLARAVEAWPHLELLGAPRLS